MCQYIQIYLYQDILFLFLYSRKLQLYTQYTFNKATSAIIMAMYILPTSYFMKSGFYGNHINLQTMHFDSIFDTVWGQVCKCRSSHQ